MDNNIASPRDANTKLAVGHNITYMKGSLKCGPSYQCVNCRNTTKYTAQNNDREEELLEEIYAEAQLQQDGDDAEPEDEIHKRRLQY